MIPLLILGPGGDFRRTWPDTTALEVNRAIERHRKRNPPPVADFTCPACGGHLDDFEPFPDQFESQAERNRQRAANPGLRGTWCCDGCGKMAEDFSR